MSNARPSSDVDLVRPVIACLVAVYAIECGRGECAEIEPLLMMRPPCGCWFRITRNASRVQRNAPVRFTATTLFHASSSRASMSTLGAPIPALLNSRSSRPCLSTTALKRLRTLASSVTSVGIASRLPVNADPRARVSSSVVWCRPARTTVQASSASARPTAAPIPLPPPVTTAMRCDIGLLLAGFEGGHSLPHEANRHFNRCADLLRGPRTPLTWSTGGRLGAQLAALAEGRDGGRMKGRREAHHDVQPTRRLGAGTYRRVVRSRDGVND